MRLYLSMAAAALLSASLAAHADSFAFTATGGGGGFTGSGTLTASPNGPDGYLISGITGAGVTSVITPGDYNDNDNLIFPSSANLVDSSGFAFVDQNGPDTFDVDIYGNGSGYFAKFTDEDNFSETIPIAFTLTSVAPTPEPSSFVLLGTGLLGMMGVARRRFLA